MVTCPARKLIFIFFISYVVTVSRGKKGSQEEDGLEFGRFDLGFAVDVLETVYEQELQRRCVLCRSFVLLSS